MKTSATQYSRTHSVLTLQKRAVHETCFFHKDCQNHKVKITWTPSGTLFLFRGQVLLHACPAGPRLQPLQNQAASNCKRCFSLDVTRHGYWNIAITGASNCCLAVTRHGHWNNATTGTSNTADEELPQNLMIFTRAGAATRSKSAFSSAWEPCLNTRLLNFLETCRRSRETPLDSGGGSTC